MDLVVATPGTLNRARQKGDLHLSRVQTVVVDEADSLLDDSFVGEVLPILQACKVAPSASTRPIHPSPPDHPPTLCSRRCGHWRLLTGRPIPARSAQGAKPRLWSLAPRSARSGSTLSRES